MDTDVVASVMAVLVSQLGYKTIDARQMIADAMQRNRAIASAEQLIDAIFQGEPR
jgi:Holliday junction DNA helicase RuvA